MYHRVPADAGCLYEKAAGGSVDSLCASYGGFIVVVMVVK
jgi:hypothetical protein